MPEVLGRGSRGEVGETVMRGAVGERRRVSGGGDGEPLRGFRNRRGCGGGARSARPRSCRDSARRIWARGAGDRGWGGRPRPSRRRAR